MSYLLLGTKQGRSEEYVYVLQPPGRAQIPLNPPPPDRV
jgi:hypothetical protein